MKMNITITPHPRRGAQLVEVWGLLIKTPDLEAIAARLGCGVCGMGGIAI